MAAISSTAGHLRRQPAQPRRRPRQGHRAAPNTPPSSPRRTSPTATSCRAPSPAGRITAHRRRGGRGRAGRAQGVHAREPAAHGLARPQLPGRGRAARLAVPAALRRRDPVSAASPSRWSWRRISRRRATPRRWSSVDYEAEAHVTDLEASARRAYEPPKKRTASSRRRSPRGDADGRFDAAPVKVDERLPAADRAPQPDGAARLDGGLGGRRQAHRLRQDPGRRRTASGYLASVFGLTSDDVRVLTPYRRRRLRLGPAPAIPALPGRAGRAGAEALGAGGADPRPDVHASATGPTRSRRSRSAPSADGTLQAMTPRRHRGHLAVRGLPGGRRQLVGPALPLRQRRARPTSSRSSTPTRPCDMRAPGAATGVFAIEIAMDELAYALGHRPDRAAPEELHRERPGRGQAVQQQGAAGLLSRRARSASAGRSATRSRAPCARAASSSAGAWPPASGKP